MEIGKIIRSRDHYRVDGISIDTHSKITPKGDWYCEYSVKKIVPKNGNAPFEVATIFRLVPVILGLEDTYAIIIDPTDTCGAKCDVEYLGYRYIPITEISAKWIEYNCFNYGLFSKDIEKMLSNYLSKKV